MADTMTITAPDVREQTRTKQPWLWNVVLLDDDAHTYEYVMKMLQTIFAMPVEKAFAMTEKVDAEGRCVLFTTHKEHAELKRDQVHAFGKDVLIASCAGSMSAVLEPAEPAGEEDDLA
jgi:ATP-dependent Clp protease adaptor protein ClpS